MVLQPSSITNTTATATAAAAKSFNAVTNGLSAHRESLLAFFSLLRAGSTPDAYAYPSILKACASLHLFPQGLLLHQRAIVSGYSPDALVSSSLVNFYAKFGRTSHARRVFDEMPQPNVVPWTAIIGCYSRQGYIDVAFSMYDSMRGSGVQPTSVTLLELLSGLSDLRRLQCLHACSIRCGFVSYTPLLNSLLNFYCRCGTTHDARRLFDSMMERRDIVSWNSMISGYAQAGYARETLELLYRMRIQSVEPDNQTFSSLVSATAILSSLELGKSVHGQILKAGFEFDAHVETSLIVMYMKCGNVNEAFRIFERSSPKDVVSWTAIISGLVQNQCADKALSVLHWMVESGELPSTETVASALAACAQLGSFDKGTSIHGYVLRHGLAVDTPAQNSLITMYAKCGHLQQSSAIFYGMCKRDVISWNAIVSGHAQNGHIREAFFLFNEMRKTLLRPDSITVVSLLQACASAGALHQGKCTHDFVIRSCFGPCILIDTALVDMYCKCGDLGTAQKCFDRMSQPDLVSWCTIIAGYGSYGKGKTALKMYAKFIETGIKPNDVIFLSVLSACSHNGLVLQGLSLFQSMKHDYGIEPKFEHRACIVDLLARAGKVQEGYGFFKKMFPEPTADILGILLDACRANGNEELGKTIAGEILMLKPVNAENFIQLAHSYASMSRWDGVGQTWIQMKSLGLKKLPGWSFVELRGAITTFFMRHTSHPQNEEIMLILKLLGSETRAMERNCKSWGGTVGEIESN